MAQITIASEADLIVALEEAIDRQIAEDKLTIEFVDWPRFEVTIRGEDFHGGVPTRLMPSLLKLQRDVDNAYARLIYGAPQRLTIQERRKTELIVRLQAGRSTTFISELAPILNNIAPQVLSKMDGTQTLIGILGIAAIFAGGYSWKQYLNTKLEAKQFDHRVEMSKEETRRAEVIAKASSRSSIVRDQAQDNQQTQEMFLKRLDPKDELVIGDTPVINGDMAREVVRRPRTPAVESRRDGEFIILTVESGQIKGYRLKVQDRASGEELTVQVPEGTLSAEQITTLQRGEWGKKSLKMQLNTRLSGGRLVEATLIEAGLE